MGGTQSQHADALMTGDTHAPPIAAPAVNVSTRDPAYLLHILDELCHSEQVIEVLIGFVDKHCVNLFTDGEEHSLQCTTLHKECT